MLLSINSFAFKWIKVAENELGKYYVDVDSIKKENGVVYYSDLIDYLQPFNDDYSAISKYKVNCEDEKQTWLNLTTYNQSMGKGIINSKSNPDETIYPKSKTIYFFIIKYVCNYKK
tara:strand:- start:986 stop:1333 length:348 start_codon:yes stop_codon:yes gene_type:complete